MKRAATRSLGAVISDFVQESHLEEGLLQVRVFAAWDALVLGQVHLGAYTARHSFRDGVLTCKMHSSVVRSHLQFQLEAIRTELNASLGLGEDIVKQIKLA